MGRIINPSEIQKPTILDDLIMKIIKSEVVLVLGHEHMLKEELSNGDLLKQITADYFNYKNEKDPHFKSHYQSFNDYYYRGADLSVLKQDIAESLDEKHYTFDPNDYSPIVRKLLEKKCFRLVLTTTFDYYAEKIMKDIWKDELRVRNIFDAKNDLDDEDCWRTDIKPTLYYVFGKAEKGKDFTVVEKDAMNVIQKWLGGLAPKNFCEYIKNKSILALGTKFDDWLFRFFWFAMQRDITRLNQGQVAISLQKNSEVEAKLSSFLENENIPNSSIEDVCNLILNTIDYRTEQYQQENGRGIDIFISYSSDSYETVKHLFYALKDHGFNVWFDSTQLNAGDKYKTVITNAINNCKVFIPVITHPVKDILAMPISDSESSFRYFRDVEWSTANSRWVLQNSSNSDGNFKILPFCMEGITMKDVKIHESQKGIMEFMSSSSAGDNRTHANFTKFISSIKNSLR